MVATSATVETFLPVVTNYLALCRFENFTQSTWRGAVFYHHIGAKPRSPTKATLSRKRLTSDTKLIEGDDSLERETHPGVRGITGEGIVAEATDPGSTSHVAERIARGRQLCSAGWIIHTKVTPKMNEAAHLSLVSDNDSSASESRSPSASAETNAERGRGLGHLQSPPPPEDDEDSMKIVLVPPTSTGTASVGPSGFAILLTPAGEDGGVEGDGEETRENLDSTGRRETANDRESDSSDSEGELYGHGVAESGNRSVALSRSRGHLRGGTSSILARTREKERRREKTLSRTRISRRKTGQQSDSESEDEDREIARSILMKSLGGKANTGDVASSEAGEIDFLASGPSQTERATNRVGDDNYKEDISPTLSNVVMGSCGYEPHARRHSDAVGENRGLESKIVAPPEVEQEMESVAPARASYYWVGTERLPIAVPSRFWRKKGGSTQVADKYQGGVGAGEHAKHLPQGEYQEDIKTSGGEGDVGLDLGFAFDMELRQIRQDAPHVSLRAKRAFGFRSLCQGLAVLRTFPNADHLRPRRTHQDEKLVYAAGSMCVVADPTTRRGSSSPKEGGRINPAQGFLPPSQQFYQQDGYVTALLVNPAAPHIIASASVHEFVGGEFKTDGDSDQQDAERRRKSRNALVSLTDDDEKDSIALSGGSSDEDIFRREVEPSSSSPSRKRRIHKRHDPDLAHALALSLRLYPSHQDAQYRVEIHIWDIMAVGGDSNEMRFQNRVHVKKANREGKKPFQRRGKDKYVVSMVSRPIVQLAWSADGCVLFALDTHGKLSLLDWGHVPSVLGYSPTSNATEVSEDGKETCEKHSEEERDQEDGKENWKEATGGDVLLGSTSLQILVEQSQRDRNQNCPKKSSLRGNPRPSSSSPSLESLPNFRVVPLGVFRGEQAFSDLDHSTLCAVGELVREEVTDGPRVAVLEQELGREEAGSPSGASREGDDNIATEEYGDRPSVVNPGPNWGANSMGKQSGTVGRPLSLTGSNVLLGSESDSDSSPQQDSSSSESVDGSISTTSNKGGSSSSSDSGVSRLISTRLGSTRGSRSSRTRQQSKKKKKRKKGSAPDFSLQGDQTRPATVDLRGNGQCSAWDTLRSAISAGGESNVTEGTLAVAPSRMKRERRKERKRRQRLRRKWEKEKSTLSASESRRRVRDRMAERLRKEMVEREKAREELRMRLEIEKDRREYEALLGQRDEGERGGAGEVGISDRCLYRVDFATSNGEVVQVWSFFVIGERDAAKLLASRKPSLPRPGDRESASIFNAGIERLKGKFDGVIGGLGLKRESVVTCIRERCRWKCMSRQQTRSLPGMVSQQRSRNDDKSSPQITCVERHWCDASAWPPKNLQGNLEASQKAPSSLGVGKLALFLVAGMSTGHLARFDGRTFRQELQAYHEPVFALFTSAEHLISCSNSGNVIVWGDSLRGVALLSIPPPSMGRGRVTPLSIALVATDSNRAQQTENGNRSALKSDKTERPGEAGGNLPSPPFRVFVGMGDGTLIVRPAIVGPNNSGDTIGRCKKAEDEEGMSVVGGVTAVAASDKYVLVAGLLSAPPRVLMFSGRTPKHVARLVSGRRCRPSYGVLAYPVDSFHPLIEGKPRVVIATEKPIVCMDFSVVSSEGGASGCVREEEVAVGFGDGTVSIFDAVSFEKKKSVAAVDLLDAAGLLMGAAADVMVPTSGTFRMQTASGVPALADGAWTRIATEAPREVGVAKPSGASTSSDSLLASSLISVQQQMGPVSRLRYSDDGDKLALGMANGQLFIVSLIRGEIRRARNGMMRRRRERDDSLGCGRTEKGIEGKRGGWEQMNRGKEARRVGWDQMNWKEDVRKDGCDPVNRREEVRRDGLELSNRTLLEDSESRIQEMEEEIAWMKMRLQRRWVEGVKPGVASERGGSSLRSGGSRSKCPLGEPVKDGQGTNTRGGSVDCNEVNLGRIHYFRDKSKPCPIISLDWCDDGRGLWVTHENHLRVFIRLYRKPADNGGEEEHIVPCDPVSLAAATSQFQRLPTSHVGWALQGVFGVPSPEDLPTEARAAREKERMRVEDDPGRLHGFYECTGCPTWVCGMGSRHGASFAKVAIVPQAALKAPTEGGEPTPNDESAAFTKDESVVVFAHHLQLTDVMIAHYPCIDKASKRKAFAGHAAPVTELLIHSTASGPRLLSGSWGDGTVIEWEICRGDVC